MRLTSRDIAAIEGFLTRIEEGHLGVNVAAFYGLPKSYGPAVVSTALRLLERIGVNVPKRENAGEKMRRELAEFRAWKAAQQAEKSRPTLLRPNSNGQYQPVS